MEEECRRGELEQVRADQLVEQILALLRSGQRDSSELFLARDRLAWLLRLQPDALATLYTGLQQVPDEALGVLLAAVGSAGTTAAQALLASFLGDERAREVLRVGAALSMFQLA